jgi:cell division inhibitor SepF
MGSWRKMGAFLGLVPQDEPQRGDYDFADEYEQGEYDATTYRGDFETDYAPRGGRDDVRRSGGAPSAEPIVQGALAVQMYPAPRRASETGSSARPLTVKLTGFAEARVIGERYRDGSSVILDMTDLSDSDARRVVDFAAGLAFALHGSIDKVTARVFMLLPPHVDMSAEDRRAFAAGGLR